MDVEVGWIGRETIRDFDQFLRADPGVYFVVRLIPSAFVRVPIAGQFAHQWLLLDLTRTLVGGLKSRADFVRHRTSVDARVLGINLPKRRVLFDGSIEQWLSDGGIVNFAVAVTAITDNVNHHIAAELV